MGNVKAYLILAAIALLALGAAYWAPRDMSKWMFGYSWYEMDWNQDGTTSFSEALSAIDIGKGGIQRDGLECMEYFRYKDASPVRVDCQNGTSRSRGGMRSWQ